MTVIDVRTEAEWKIGHLEGALHIEWQDILKIPSDIQKDEEIYLYCRSGNRSGKATKILLEAGYINAKNAGSLFDASESLGCLLYTSPSPRDYAASRMPSSA